MDYRIEHIEYELRFVGRGMPVQTRKAFNTIPTLWSNAKKEGFINQLKEMAWENPKCTLEGLLGVCGNKAAITDDEFTYFMGVRYEREIPSNMEFITIQPSTWAVFPNITEAWTQLYSEWVPTSGYELATLPCIECYYGPKHKPRNELWVPIIAK